jgi:NAD(P)-dependent dehydrogenase (short-subunit alcohol dehydrogenase family)
LTGRLESRVAVVTGAGSGIGAAVATAFSSEGARVAVWDIDGARARTVANDIGGFGVGVDVSDRAAVHRAMESSVEALGGLDILYNNAGIVAPGSVGVDPEVIDTVVDIPENALRRVIDINLFGVFFCSQAAIPHMLKQGRGVIINTASGAAHAGFIRQAAYSASKGGVVALTRQIMADYSPLGVRAVCISPVRIETEMLTGILAAKAEGRAEMSAQHPIRRLGVAGDVAHLAVFLASDEASFLTGTVVPVDGGYLAM